MDDRINKQHSLRHKFRAHAWDAYHVYRIGVILLAVLSCTYQIAFAQAPAPTPVPGAPGASGNVIVDMGTRILGFIFTLAGVAAALGGAVVGVKMIVGSTVGSAFATANAILALIGVFGGLALAVAGPSIGAAIVEMTSSMSRAIVVPQ